MLTKEEAILLVQARLKERSSKSKSLVINEMRTVDKPYGWIFFAVTEQFLKSGSASHVLLGSGPIIVNKDTGDIWFGGAAQHPESVIQEYEQRLREKNNQP